MKSEINCSVHPLPFCLQLGWLSGCFWLMIDIGPPYSLLGTHPSWHLTCEYVLSWLRIRYQNTLKICFLLDISFCIPLPAALKHLDFCQCFWYRRLRLLSVSCLRSLGHRCLWEFTLRANTPNCSLYTMLVVMTVALASKSHFCILGTSPRTPLSVIVHRSKNENVFVACKWQILIIAVPAAVVILHHLHFQCLSLTLDSPTLPT